MDNERWLLVFGVFLPISFNLAFLLGRNQSPGRSWRTSTFLSVYSLPASYEKVFDEEEARKFAGIPALLAYFHLDRPGIVVSGVSRSRGSHLPARVCNTLRALHADDVDILKTGFGRVNLQDVLGVGRSASGYQSAPMGFIPHLTYYTRSFVAD